MTVYERITNQGIYADFSCSDVHYQDSLKRLANVHLTEQQK